MKRTTTTNVKGILVTALLGALPLAGCHKPLPRDPSGKPLFDEKLVRHPRDTPYFCFSMIDARGDQVSECHEIKEWCTSAARRQHSSGRTVLSACRPVEEVSCYVAYGTGGIFLSSQALCWETPKDCAAMNAVSVEMAGGDNVSACKTLDRAFQPSR